MVLRWTTSEETYEETFDNPVEFLNIRPLVADEYERRLLNAVCCNDAKGVRLALGSGYVSPDVIFSSFTRNTRDGGYRYRVDTSPLYLAVELGHLPCVLALIEHGADVNGTFVTEFCEPEGTRWPIHAAARNGNVNCLIELLVRGAEVHTWPLFCRTSELHLAARHGHVECVSVLLNFTAELRKTSAERMSLVDDEGKTPLHLAAEHGHRGCVRELLRCGASTDVTNHNGVTPFELAVENGHADAWDVSYEMQEADGCRSE